MIIFVVEGSLGSRNHALLHPAINMAPKKAAMKGPAAKAKAKAAHAPASREDRIHLEHNMGDAFGTSHFGLQARE
jgi:hypothetical protein